MHACTRVAISAVPGARHGKRVLGARGALWLCSTTPPPAGPAPGAGCQALHSIPALPCPPPPPARPAAAPPMRPLQVPLGLGQQLLLHGVNVALLDGVDRRGARRRPHQCERHERRDRRQHQARARDAAQQPADLLHYEDARQHARPVPAGGCGWWGPAWRDQWVDPSRIHARGWHSSTPAWQAVSPAHSLDHLQALLGAGRPALPPPGRGSCDQPIPGHAAQSRVSDRSTTHQRL